MDFVLGPAESDVEQSALFAPCLFAGVPAGDSSLFQTHHDDNSEFPSLRAVESDKIQVIRRAALPTKKVDIPSANRAIAFGRFGNTFQHIPLVAQRHV